MAIGRSCDEWKPFFVMLAIDLAFAVVNILLKKVLEEGIDHLVLITYRLGISAIFLSPIGYFLERPKLTISILCYLFFSAIVGASLTQYFFLLGIQYTSATFSCAFINIVPVVTFIMALPFRLETVDMKSSSGRAKIVGTLVCVGGALMLTLYRGRPFFNTSHSQAVISMHDHATKLSSANKTQNWTIGLICLVLGTLLWSLWFLLQSKIGKRYPCQYSSTAIMCSFGSIQSAALSFVTSRSLSIWVLRGRTEVFTVLFAGMVGSGLCYVGMSWCVKKRGPVFTAAFSPLVQIMAAMFDIPILHEQLHIGSLLGSVIVIIGLYILLWGKNKELKDRIMKVVQEAEEIKEQEPKLQVITVSCESQST
ncbi:WAT1-related protein At3g30340 isoform X2 [Syzygium oleosum]|uniref:WAT1-related protein At3g30340 isoform X2 n=1 Tax=Syzygium oleosum TaxID=219896 RepID=UPI0024BBAE64|nr:WAT1-related protein At3g30340 isoform X2 [Syzygium oleosum]